MSLMRRLGRRPSGQEIYAHAGELFQKHGTNGYSGQMLQVIMRMSIKSNPYLPNISHMIGNYEDLTRHRIRSEMPRLLDCLERCNVNGLPIPIIISCKKYLHKAKDVAKSLKPHYFDIEPIIIIGGNDCRTENFQDQILQLPVNDDYEGLPYKMFEAYTLLNALGAKIGVIKIDDDISVCNETALDLEEVRTAFKFVDYMGNIMGYPHFDRAWHFGKCASPMPAIYGKPFIAPYANGPLYFLSKAALSKLATHYLKYPGCLDGEIYEDKIVGDVLNFYGVRAEHNPLQYILKIDTDAPDRLVG
ncbi:hypothetical protein [Methylobacterium pseudosasicola]|nr:hypothetical protein [Methylobacterium pseudosasicola]